MTVAAFTQAAQPSSKPGGGAAALASACARGDAALLFAQVDRQAADVLAHTLCTINRLDEPQLRLQRLYSSNPEAYPPGGKKDKAGTSWGRHVLQERQIFIGEGLQAIAQSFDDHDAIAALGLRSVINVPVVFEGTCLGTVNFLMTSERVREEDVEAARWSALMALPGFLMRV